jgi:deferrochelatase/peroxidase EfeB
MALASATTIAAPHVPQLGILGRPPEHLLIAAFSFAGDRSADRTRETLELLRHLVKRELRSDLDTQTPSTPKDQPSPETGELGFADGYDRQFLTVTVGLGAGTFDALATPLDQRPQDLVPIPWPALGDQPPAIADNGDVVVQVCADDPYVAEHVVRRTEEELVGRLTLVWVMRGDQRYTTREGRVNKHEARALIGFQDGTANLDPKNVAADANLVFVNPDSVGQYPKLPPPNVPSPYGPATAPVFPADLRQPPNAEPEWSRGGTYMVVRGSAHKIRDWDAVNLGEQESAVGRFKFSGASLDREDKVEQRDLVPVFAEHPEDVRVPTNSHIRKVNPHGPGDDQRRIYRRGYPLIESRTGTLLRGLVFICFGRSISTQFEFIVRGWMNNPNFPSPGTGRDKLQERFEETVLAGGYFFVPALSHRTLPWSWILPK